MLRKQRAGREAKAWESFSEIRDAFAAEVLQQPAVFQGAAASFTAGASKDDVLNILDADTGSILKVQYNLEIGNTYMNNEQHGAKVWALMSVDGHGCTNLVCS